MFSVIIPLHNKAESIKFTIESILNQSFTDFELIIVDDASTDESVPIVRGYDDKRIKIHSISHAGVSEARNVGIRSATHEWIAFLDADDWWSTDYLEVLSEAIAVHPNRKLFAVGQQIHKPQSITKRFVNLPKPTQRFTSIDYLCHMAKYGSPLQTSCTCVSKGLLDKVGLFVKGLNHYEDIELWLRLGIEEPVLFIDSYLSHYRQTGGDTLSTKKWPYEEAMLYLRMLRELEVKASSGESQDCLAMLYSRMLRAIGIHEFPKYTAYEQDAVVKLVRENYSTYHFVQILLYKYLSVILRVEPVMNLYHSVTLPIRTLRRSLS